MGSIGGALPNYPCYSSIAHYSNIHSSSAIGIAAIANSLGGIFFIE